MPKIMTIGRFFELWKIIIVHFFRHGV